MSYAVLDQMPPQKAPPTHALPCVPTVPIATRRRSATVFAISAWAAQIVPGSPAPLTPRSPYTVGPPRTPRTPRTPRRRSCSAGLRSPVNFLSLVDTPSTANLRTPSERDLEKRQAALGFDLLAQGYTSAVVQLPTLSPIAPRTAPANRTTIQIEDIKPPVPPIPASPTFKAPSRLRSLSFKSAKKAAKAMLAHAKPSSGSSAAHHAASQKPSKHHSSSKSKSSTPVARYAHLIAPGGGAGAMSLTAEVQLSQMLDGGSLDANIKRVTHRHAKDTGAIKRSRSRDPTGDDRVGGGVSGVYRDDKGRMWWDEDEALELTGLLPNAPTSATSSAALPPPPPKKSILPRKSKESRMAKEQLRGAPAPGDWVSMDNAVEFDGEDVARRGSASAMSDTSRDSDLDPYRAVCPRDNAGLFVPGYKMTSGADSVGMHDAFAVSPLDAARTGSTDAAPRSRPRPRHRPAPLTLSPPEVPPQAISHRTESRSQKHSRTATSATVPPLLPTQVPAPLATEGKRDFLASSFAPPTGSIQGHNGKENSSAKAADGRASRRGSVNFAKGLNALANTVKSARRASTSTASLSPTTNYGGMPMPAHPLHNQKSGSAVHLPLAQHPRVQAHATGPTMKVSADSDSTSSGKRSLRHKSSKLDVRGLFRSRS